MAMPFGVLCRVFSGPAALLGAGRGAEDRPAGRPGGGLADDKLAAELLKLLPVLRAQLEESVKASEEGVLSAAGALREMTALVRRSLTCLQEALQVQEDNRRRREQEFHSVFERLDEELGRLKGRLGAVEELYNHILGLERERGEKLFAVLKDLGEISSRTRVVTINAAIEAARLGEKGRGFAVVVRELQRLTGQAEQTVQTVQQFGRYLLDGVRSNVTYLENQLEELKSVVAGLEHSQREARKLMDTHRQWEDAATKDTARLATELKTADRHLDEGITAFQFQDAVAQQVAHVREVLRRVENLLSGGEDTESLDILRELEAMYTMERERVTHRQARRPDAGADRADGKAENVEFF